ncbi:MAG TPA: glycerophosphodiester phosphodiesterase [Candidatus Saccharimonadales bacterium]|nr:glycerophosphodiester phosphodiesterase [Candidatus Saccharimonadales bacterium]
MADGTPLPLVIAHRGASRDAPGNSPDAFEAAIAQGADAVELDVRRTSDGVLVVHHNASRRGVPVAMQTYAALVRRSRNEPARLEAILDLCRGRTGLDVEIKEPGFEAEVIEAASSRFPRELLLYTSFEESVIATIRRLDPKARCGLLLGPGRLRSRAQRYEGLPFDLAERCGADLLAVHQWLAPLRTRSRGRNATGTGLLAEAHLRQFPLMVWTVDGPQRLRAYLADGRVAGIITDLPGLAVETRRDIATHGAQEDSMPAHVTGLSRPALTDRVRPMIPR